MNITAWANVKRFSNRYYAIMREHPDARVLQEPRPTPLMCVEELKAMDLVCVEWEAEVAYA